jgi:hypothetical protein
LPGVAPVAGPAGRIITCLGLRFRPKNIAHRMLMLPAWAHWQLPSPGE